MYNIVLSGYYNEGMYVEVVRETIKELDLAKEQYSPKVSIKV